MACTPQQHTKVASHVRRVRSRLVGRSAARSDGRFGVINTPRPACVWFSRAFGRKSNHPGEQRWVQKRIKETAVDYAILYDLSERMRGEFAVGGMVRGWGSRCKCFVRFGRNRHSSAIESPPRFAVLQNCREMLVLSNLQNDTHFVIYFRVLLCSTAALRGRGQKELRHLPCYWWMCCINKKQSN